MLTGPKLLPVVVTIQATEPNLTLLSVCWSYLVGEVFLGSPHNWWVGGHHRPSQNSSQVALTAILLTQADSLFDLHDL